MARKNRKPDEGGGSKPARPRRSQKGTKDAADMTDEERRKALDEATAKIRELRDKLVYASSPIRARMDQAHAHLKSFVSFIDLIEEHGLDLITVEDGKVARSMLEECLRVASALMYRVAADYEPEEWAKLELEIARIALDGRDRREEIASFVASEQREDASPKPKRGKKRR